MTKTNRNWNKQMKMTKKRINSNKQKYNKKKKNIKQVNILNKKKEFYHSKKKITRKGDTAIMYISELDTDLVCPIIQRKTRKPATKNINISTTISADLKPSSRQGGFLPSHYGLIIRSRIILLFLLLSVEWYNQIAGVPFGENSFLRGFNC